VPFLTRHSLQIVGSLKGHDRFSSTPDNTYQVAIIGVRQGGAAWQFYAHVAADFAGRALARRIL
jgi:hypothetical protein